MQRLRHSVSDLVAPSTARFSRDIASPRGPGKALSMGRGVRLAPQLDLRDPTPLRRAIARGRASARQTRRARERGSSRSPHGRSRRCSTSSTDSTASLEPAWTFLSEYTISFCTVRLPSICKKASVVFWSYERAGRYLAIAFRAWRASSIRDRAGRQNNLRARSRRAGLGRRRESSRTAGPGGEGLKNRPRAPMAGTRATTRPSGATCLARPRADTIVPRSLRTCFAGSPPFEKNVTQRHCNPGDRRS